MGVGVWIKLAEILFSGDLLKTLGPSGFTENRELSDKTLASQG
jgi:hypothetical protein